MSPDPSDVVCRRRFMTVAGHTIYPAGLSAAPIVVDLGANHGRFSQLLRNILGGGEFYLVEANPYLVSELRASQTCPVISCAVAKRDGRIKFNLSTNDEGSSLFSLREPSDAGPGCALREQVEVPSKTLNNILGELPHPIFDLVKFDIEGGEVLALRDCSRDLLARIRQITIEFHSHPMFGFEIERQVQEIISRMRIEGFLVLDFSYGALIDVLMINKNLCRISAIQELLWKIRLGIPRWSRPAARFVPSRIRRWVANRVKALAIDAG
jgi:FkbM family methyltransferase